MEYIYRSTVLTYSWMCLTLITKRIEAALDGCSKMQHMEDFRVRGWTVVVTCCKYHKRSHTHTHNSNVFQKKKHLCAGVKCLYRALVDDSQRASSPWACGRSVAADNEDNDNAVHLLSDFIQRLTFKASLMRVKCSRSENSTCCISIY